MNRRAFFLFGARRGGKMTALAALAAAGNAANVTAAPQRALVDSTPLCPRCGCAVLIESRRYEKPLGPWACSCGNCGWTGEHRLT